jgi:alpha-mannosidase
MNIPNLVLTLLTPRCVPPVFLRAAVRLAVALLRWRQAREDRRQAAAPPTHPAPAGPLYLVDGYHGGVVFWDWLALPGGGLWYLYNWPLCLRPALERALRDDRFRITLDLDGWTYEDMAVRAPEAIRQMREALRLGRLEVVNGTYGQPLALSVSGESFIRQLFYGLEAIGRVLGAEVTVFYSQEPAYFPQLPQILRGFGFRGVILRTQWAAFGTDPACDAAVVRWQGPDGSTIPAVPRYTFQRYDRLRAEHPGLPHMALAAGERADWEPESLAPFERAARERGIAHPLVTDLKDVNLPDAPLPHALALAATPNVRFVTPSEYFALAGEEGPTVAYTPDDIPSTLPWGLQAEGLMRARVAAERALLTAERLDAVAYLLGRESQEEHLAEAWKNLCLAQHHDLHVCGPWHSRRHGCSMAEVGVEYAERARRAAGEVTRAALAYLAEGAGGDILVFNPSPWPRREYVEVPVNRRINPALQILVDDAGEVPCQWVPAGDGDWRVGFALDLPPLGYRCLRWVPDQTAMETEPFQNPWYRATVHPDGSLSLEVDGQPLITAGGYLTVWRDGAWYDSRSSVRRVEVSEEGPVCCRYRIEGEVAGIPFRQTVTLYRTLPRIDGRVVLDFGDGVYLGPQLEDDRPERAMSVQDEKKLCLAFATPLSRAWCDSPFLVAPTGGERMVGLHGIGLEDGDGAGVAFFHRGTPGYHLDRREGVLRNVLAWGPREWIYASDNSVTRGRSRYTALRGRQEYEYAILPYTPRGARFVLPRAALDFQLPCRWQMLQALSGRPAVPRSFLSVEPESVLATALFVHRGRAYIRLWNASGQEAVAAIRTPWVREWHPVDLRLRRDGAPLPSDNIPLPPWGIRTLEI